MKRKHTFTYRPATGQGQNVLFRDDIPQARGVVTFISAATLIRPLRLVIEDRDDEDPRVWTGQSSTPVWAFAREDRFPGLELESIAVEFANARVPESDKKKMALNGSEWLSGDAWYLHIDVEGPKEVYINVLICGLPSKETVSVKVEVALKYPLREYIRAFFNAQHAVEQSLRQTQALKQLLQAFRTDPPNGGFVTRSIREMYATIAPV